MIAYYMRLSNADAENAGNVRYGSAGNKGSTGGACNAGHCGCRRESDSIDSQRLTLLNYQKKHLDIGGLSDLLGHLEYIDDGFTGRNFKRPGWTRLIEDCKKGKVDTVLVKDSSRLGRNHVEVENYLQMVFPVLKVRVICVQEGYDSKVSVTGEAISFQNIINDYYSQDIGIKIQSSFHQMWKKGELSNVKTPYGYVCRSRRKGYEVDPEAAGVVRRIFAEAAEGKTTRLIADALNKDGVPDPYSYLMKRDGSRSKFEEKMDATRVWTTGTVYKILRNESYTGVRIAHRSTKSRAGKTVRVPEEGQFRFEDDHEPLVSRELFEKGAAVIGRRAGAEAGGGAAGAGRPEGAGRKDGGGKEQKQRLFQGFLRCGNCHRLMDASRSSYRCCMAKESEFTGCPGGKFREEGLKEKVWAILLWKAAKAKKILEGQEEVPVADGIEEEIRYWKKRLMDAFEEMSGGGITMEDFIRTRDECREKVAKLMQERSGIAGKNGYRIDLEYALKPLAGLEKKAGLVREVLENLVEAVYVSGDRIEVVTRAEKYLGD